MLKTRKQKYFIVEVYFSFIIKIKFQWIGKKEFFENKTFNYYYY